MKKKNCLWIPIDLDVNNVNYKIPIIENQMDVLRGLEVQSDNDIVANCNDSDDDSDDDNNQFAKRIKPFPPFSMANLIARRFNDFVSSWIEVMGYSQNINGVDINIRFCDQSTSLIYMALSGKTIPHIVFRSIGKKCKRILPIIEFEMYNVRITEISTDGIPYESNQSLQLNSKVVTVKNIKMNTRTGRFETYQVCKSDQLKNTGSKTLYNTTSNSLQSDDNSLISDSKLKEMGVFSDEIPGTEEDIEKNYKKIYISKEPFLILLFKATQPHTIQSYKKSIAERLSIPVETIMNLYDAKRGILLEDRFLNNTNFFIIQTTDGKFIGYQNN